MSEHTRGPWTLGDENNESAEVCMGDVAVSLDRRSRDPGRCGLLVIGREEMLANARLIAAAPDLLEALERLAQSVEGAVQEDYDNYCPHCDHYIVAGTVHAKDCPLVAAQAAIAKARGTR